jgi:hypothetical protein
MAVPLRTMPRRYRINKWTQLNKIPSDNSSAVRIKVSEFCNSGILQGTNINITDPKRGTVFAYTINAQGTLPNSEVSELSVEQILQELARWGFNVEFSPEFNLSEAQSRFIRSFLNMGCTHMRAVNVKDIKGTFLIAFNVNDNRLLRYPRNFPRKLLDITYEFQRQEWNELLTCGIIQVNKQENYKQFSWNWLHFVADINDLVTRFTVPTACCCRGRCVCS